MKQWAVIVLILLWLGFHLAVPIDLVGSDLGRHIKNGELIAHGQWDVLYKNYYSYTYPQYPFINHHWLFGVFCYGLWHYFGFSGISVIYLVLELFTFYLFFCLARRHSSFPLACAFGLLSFPLITLRSEIRPEGISYLFCGLFCYLTDLYQQQRLKPAYLMAALALIQVIWVNTHIFFIVGPVLMILYWCQACSDGEARQIKVFQKIFWLLIGMCLINPSGIGGMLVPFHIDKAYSYPITENRSVFYYLTLKLRINKSFYFYFLATAGMLMAGLIFLIKRGGFKKHIFSGALTLLLVLASMKAIRMIGLYGFFWIPLSSYAFSKWLDGAAAKSRKDFQILLVVMGILVSASVSFNWKQAHGFGLVPGVDNAAQFFKRERISGPVFNNYNIGGYLIFYLAPGYKFFVDDRMEAFPGDFFKQIYIPMQLKDDVWKGMDRKYRFNVIFYNRETTVWGYKFLLDCFTDPSWVLVYLDQKGVMIFLKRNAQNAAIIRRFEKHIRIITRPPPEIIKQGMSKRN